MFWTHYSLILCLFGFCKITCTLHLIFTSLAGIIFRPLFTAFCKCYRIWCLFNFFPRNFSHALHLVHHVHFNWHVFSISSKEKSFAYTLQLCLHDVSLLFLTIFFNLFYILLILSCIKLHISPQCFKPGTSTSFT